MRRLRENKELRPAVIQVLKNNGWHIEITHGSMYQSGFPDLLIFHRLHGIKWIELKIPGGKLSRNQFDKFALWQDYKVGIWVVEHVKQLPEILFTPPNWAQYI